MTASAKAGGAVCEGAGVGAGIETEDEAFVQGVSVPSTLGRLREGRERRSFGGAKKGLSWSAAMSSGDADASSFSAGSTPKPSETKNGLPCC